MTFEEFNNLDKKIIAADKVMENYRVNSWNDQFLYRTIITNNLDSLFLDNNE